MTDCSLSPWIMLGALVFSVVPPSCNPSAKLNRDLQQSLVQQLHIPPDAMLIQQGRIRFSTTAQTPDCSRWPALLSTVKSLRWVMTQVDTVTCTDNEASLATKLDASLQAHVPEQTIRDVYQSFGNTLSLNENIKNNK